MTSSLPITMASVIDTLMHRRDLTRDQSSFAMEEILSGRCDPNQLSAFITLLRSKGETADELASLVATMWDNTPDVSDVDVAGAIDTCGTGGDNSGTFNISTAVSLLISAAGIPVAKHGNRAATSHSGAADVLEALGIPVDLSVGNAKTLFAKTGYVFLFAPTYHGGMRHAGPVRAALGVRTTFNFLGPLANPYRAPIRLHGVSDGSITETYAHTLKTLGVKRAYVFHGYEGLDEISLNGVTKGFDLRDGVITARAIIPQDLGYESAPIEALAGGNAVKNAKIIHNIFSGEIGPMRDIVTLNAAVAYDLVRDSGVETAVKVVAEIIDSGKALAQLETIKKCVSELG